jgi:hypothetical protein
VARVCERVCERVHMYVRVCKRVRPAVYNVYKAVRALIFAQACCHTSIVDKG